jgi:lipopolysaccharide/colanic/teichoic acid biosynthesis glycosyltransferase
MTTERKKTSNKTAATGWASPVPRWKRVIDLTCCLVALPVLGLLTLATTVVMKFLSPGPVFFRQERVGYRGRRFKLYKFRTMKVGSDTKIHQAHFDHLVHFNIPMVKMDAKGDSRLVPGGWLLRSSGLDELPQIINVLRGEMSLVGPRPCIPYEYEQFTPAQRQRVSAVPGLTGLWQVSGKNRTTFDEMIRLDIHYAKHGSLWLDLKIMLLTPFAMLLQIYDTRKGRMTLVQTARAETTAPMMVMEPPKNLPSREAVMGD